jgi:hypothetical protein
LAEREQVVRRAVELEDADMSRGMQNGVDVKRLAEE